MLIGIFCIFAAIVAWAWVGASLASAPHRLNKQSPERKKDPKAQVDDANTAAVGIVILIPIVVFLIWLLVQVLKFGNMMTQ